MVFSAFNVTPHIRTCLQNKVFLFSLGCAIIEHRSPASVCYLPLIRQFLSRILKILIRN